jgi:trans-aconitate methyltransferase
MSTCPPNPSYLGVRDDMLAMVPSDLQLGRVLDVGCAAGATSQALSERYPGLETTGIELDTGLAERARAHLGRVLVGDAAEQLRALSASHDERFDLVLCGDVLEHLEDPWAALSTIRALCPAGRVIVSLPNVAHISTLAALLLRSHWPYRDRGIHDRTHLRFFGRANLHELYRGAGFTEIARRTRHRVIERPHPLNERLAPLLRRVPVVSRLTEYQFISLLKPG